VLGHVSTKKIIFETKNISPLYYSFHATGHDSCATIIAAVWVTDGCDRCIIGRVNPAAIKMHNQLEGRICQVVEFFTNSGNPSKASFSEKNGGVIQCQIIDKYVPGDDVLNVFVKGFDDDDDE